ncbi:hypothetical protein FACS1894137_04400 [Spirochaetia bacterium]|nr:hypothetical protein FACS1894137_04400 [Spirochaetia bacterium]
MNFNTTIGIRQVIRYEWMQYTLKLLESGLDEKSIKKELEVYLSTRRGSGQIGRRSDCATSIAVTILMNIWISPRENLLPFRDKLLKYSQQPAFEKVCHWSMISAAYPFWFNICYVFGSLFKIQNQIKKTQVMKRIYEILGERNTVERCSRQVIRSLVSWGIIKDIEEKGIYEKGDIISITDFSILSLLFESALFSINDNKLQISSLNNCPAFFHFDFPLINGTQLSKLNDNIIVEQYSIDNEYLSIKNKIIHS